MDAEGDGRGAVVSERSVVGGRGARGKGRPARRARARARSRRTRRIADRLRFGRFGGGNEGNAIRAPIGSGDGRRDARARCGAEWRGWARRARVEAHLFGGVALALAAAAATALPAPAPRAAARGRLVSRRARGAAVVVVVRVAVVRRAGVLLHRVRLDLVVHVVVTHGARRRASYHASLPAAEGAPR